MSQNKPNLQFDFKAFWQADAAKLVAAAEYCKLIQRHKDIRAAGEETEAAVRRLFTDRLPSAYGVENGHIIDKKGQHTGELDVIITDAVHVAPFFRGADNSAWLPFEPVYAVGEVKSTFRLCDLDDIVNKVKSVRNLERTDTAPRQNVSLGTPGNPTFFFVIAVNSDVSNLNIFDQKLSQHDINNLPNVFCFLDTGIIMYSTAAIDFQENVGEALGAPQEEYYPQHGTMGSAKSGWTVSTFGVGDEKFGMNLARLYFDVWWHLSHSRLGCSEQEPYEIRSYIANFLVRNKIEWLSP